MLIQKQIYYNGLNTPGKIINKKFRSKYNLLHKKLIDIGGQSRIYQIETYDEQKKYVLKVVPNIKYGIAPAAYREKINLDIINHQNVMKIVDFYTESDNSLFIYENAGISLSRIITQLKQRNQRIPSEQRLYIAKQILQALDECHKHGIAHNDVKPQNIMLNQDAECKLIDFGISGKKFTQQGTLTFQDIQQIWGQSNTLQQFNPMASDIFQFGITYLNMVLNLNGDTEHVYTFLSGNQQTFSQMQILKLQQQFVYFDERAPLHGIKDAYLQILFSDNEYKNAYALEQILRQNVSDILDLEAQLLKMCLVFQQEYRCNTEQMLQLLKDVQKQKFPYLFEIEPQSESLLNQELFTMQNVSLQY